MMALAQHNINLHHGATMDTAELESRIAVLEKRLDYQGQAIDNLIRASIQQSQTISIILGSMGAKMITTTEK